MLYTVVNTDNGRVAQTFIELSDQEAYSLNREAFYASAPERWVPVQDDDDAKSADVWGTYSLLNMQDAMEKAGIA